MKVIPNRDEDDPQSQAGIKDSDSQATPASGKLNEDALVNACPQFRDRKTNCSLCQLLDSGELASKALNAGSPHAIALRQCQQSQVLGTVQI